MDPLPPPVATEHTPHPNLTTINMWEIVALFLIGSWAIVIGIVLYMRITESARVAANLAHIPTGIVPSLKPSTSPTPDAKAEFEKEILYKGDIGTFTYGDVNVASHSANLYKTYFDTHSYSENKTLFMGPISLENMPVTIITNEKRFAFRFVGPGDGYADFVANIQPPYQVTSVSLPQNYNPPIASKIIGWMNETTLLFSVTQNSSTTYWTAPFDNISAKKQVTYP